MPITLEVYSSCLILAFIDKCHEDIGTAIRMALDDHDLPPGAGILLDFRRCSDTHSPESLRTEAKALNALHRDGLISSRCARLIGPGLHQFGVARMAATFADLLGIEMEIFTDREEALRRLQAGNGHTFVRTA
jgi:hypothetical protein